jgi:hypothetical protein
MTILSFGKSNECQGQSTAVNIPTSTCTSNAAGTYWFVTEPGGSITPVPPVKPSSSNASFAGFCILALIAAATISLSMF